MAIAIGGGSKASFSISRDHMTNESRDLWVRYPHPISQRLKQEQQNSITKIFMYYKLGQLVLQIGAALFYKLGKRFIITN